MVCHYLNGCQIEGLNYTYIYRRNFEISILILKMAKRPVLSVVTIGLSILALVLMIIAAATPGWLVISIPEREESINTASAKRTTAAFAMSSFSKFSEREGKSISTSVTRNTSVIAMSPFYNIYKKCCESNTGTVCVQDDLVIEEYGKKLPTN